MWQCNSHSGEMIWLGLTNTRFVQISPILVLTTRIEIGIGAWSQFVIGELVFLSPDERMVYTLTSRLVCSALLWAKLKGRQKSVRLRFWTINKQIVRELFVDDDWHTYYNTKNYFRFIHFSISTEFWLQNSDSHCWSPN